MLPEVWVLDIVDVAGVAVLKNRLCSSPSVHKPGKREPNVLGFLSLAQRA